MPWPTTTPSPLQGLPRPGKAAGRNGKNGTVPHVEHKLSADAEFCPSGMPFKKATDGREPRHSAQPVEFAPARQQQAS